MIRRLAEYAAAALVFTVSAAAQLWTTLRLARRPCPHQMVAMSDGPVCGACGKAWIWREVSGR